ncbi:porin [Candidatus Pelagibacter sp.]|nr:porin [Candidatus Pelagibacter sp.]
MNNLKKVGLTALAGALASVSVNAADLSVTGTASINLYQEEGKDSGNGWTMGDVISFSASQELDNGMTVTVNHALDDGVIDDRSVTVAGVMGGTFTFHGKDGSSVLGSKDDTTPTAGEEAWGDVTGATAALGGASSEDMMHYSNSSLMDGVTFAVAYVPSGGTTEEESSVDYGVEYTNDMGLTAGIAMGENNADADASIESTIIYANMVLDAFTVGVTISEADSETANADTDFQAFGISFAATEELSMSINSSSHDYELSTSQDQDALGVSISYVMGSMTFTANHNTVDNIAGTGSDDRSGYNLNLAFAF